MKAATWWDRNWKWAVPAVCLVLLALVFAGVAAVMNTLKSTAAYSDGVALARGDCEVQRLLGVPISPGWLVSGSVSVSGPSGTAELSVPLNGQRGRGTLYVSASRSAGRWNLKQVQLAVHDGAARIDLLAEDRSRCP